MTRILVIEDERTLLEEILDILRFENFDAVGASNGLEGLELARRQAPDLVICDIVMPLLDGYDVLNQFRHDPGMAATPFIFLTAKAEKHDLRAGMQLGADDYLTKPFGHDDLLNAIHTQLDKSASRSYLNEQRMGTLRYQILTALPHEMRTPLVGILGSAELLALEGATMTPDMVVHMGEMMQRSAMRLHHLIENYLVYVEIELVSQDEQCLDEMLRISTYHPEAVIEEHAAAIARRKERPGDLEIQLSDLPPVRMAQQYLSKVVEELVDNAFKFSSPGTPVQVSTLSNNHHAITLQITDQGRGMTAQQINMVGAYMQFDRKMYEQQGSGMGLIVAKRLMELHGGELEIQSAPHQGTTVLCRFFNSRS